MVVVRIVVRERKVKRKEVEERIRGVRRRLSNRFSMKKKMMMMITHCVNWYAQL